MQVSRQRRLYVNVAKEQCFRRKMCTVYVYVESRSKRNASRIILDFVHYTLYTLCLSYIDD